MLETKKNKTYKIKFIILLNCLDRILIIHILYLYFQHCLFENFILLKNGFIGFYTIFVVLTLILYILSFYHSFAHARESMDDLHRWDRKGKL